jgi:arylsulfatase A-like enzyme
MDKKMMLTRKLLILGFPFLVCTFCSCDRFKLTKPRPNVIIFIVDSLRADSLGCYGNPYDTTPYLDEFSEKGVRFVNTYSHSTHTKLSIATLFSGLLPPSNGIRSVGASDISLLKLPAGIITLAETFNKNGYHTFGFSNNAYIVKEFQFTQGFDEFFYIGGKNPKQATAEIINKTALKRLSAVNDRPFFAYLHYMDVHLPYLPPAQFKNLFTKGLARSRPYYRIGPYKSKISDSQVAYTKAMYHATIRYWDDEFGKFITAMENKGILKDDLVVVTADHGEEFYEHGGFGHNFTIYEETLRIPLIMAWPGSIHKGLKRNDMARIIDIYPTIANLAGLDVSEIPLQGRDLFEKGFTGDKYENLDNEVPILYAETFRIKIPRCILFQNKKLIYNKATGTYEFYKLDQDSRERVNLYNPYDPAIKELSFRLHKMMNLPRLFEKAEDDSQAILDAEKIEALKSLGYLE